MKPISEQTKLVEKYLKKFPNAASNSLATKIYNENVGSFKDKEQVRQKIRIFKGAMGKRSRLELTNKSFYTKTAWDKLSLDDIVEGEDDAVPHFVIPRIYQNTLVISDLHIPYHNKMALELALKYGMEHNVDSILINGDYMDFAPLSHYTKDPYTKTRLRQHLDIGIQILAIIRNTFPDAMIWLKQGNHELWLTQYLQNKAPELLDMEEFHLKSLLRFKEFGIQEIDSYQMIKYGKLNIVHGHELKQTLRSVNPARTLYLKTKTSTLVAHHHVTSEHTESDIDGKITTCWSMACLSQLKPKYAGLDSKYNHGFVHLTKTSNGNFKLSNKRIIDNEVV